MITQMFINGWANFLANFMTAVPALPPELQDSLDQFSDGISTLGTYIAKLGPLIPFDVIGGFFIAFTACLAWWGIVQIMRIAFWLVGR